MTQDRAQLFDLSQAGRYRDRELSNNMLLSAHAHTTVGYLFQVVEENQRQVRSFKKPVKRPPRERRWDDGQAANLANTPGSGNGTRTVTRGSVSL